MPTVAKVLRNIFAVDLRALAAMRVAVGILLIADLAIRAGDLGAWMSDRGVLPRDMLLESASRWQISHV